MFVGSFDREEMEDAKLARLHPEAYEEKVKAEAEYNPIVDFFNFLRNILGKRTK